MEITELAQIVQGNTRKQKRNNRNKRIKMNKYNFCKPAINQKVQLIGAVKLKKRNCHLVTNTSISSAAQYHYFRQCSSLIR